MRIGVCLNRESRLVLIDKVVATIACAHGEVRHVTLDGNARQCDYRTTVEYEDGFHWEYTGFAWGYGGEGPNGLVTFMSEATYSDRDSWRKLIFGLEPELKDFPLL